MARAIGETERRRHKQIEHNLAHGIMPRAIVKQVRDLMHIDDACDLMLEQLAQWPMVVGRTMNAGGGLANSLSLRETTSLCAEITGVQLPTTSDLATHESDVRVYITDQRALSTALHWTPRRAPRHCPCGVRVLHLPANQCPARRTGRKLWLRLLKL